jgi:hypothetical protein
MATFGRRVMQVGSVVAGVALAGCRGDTVEPQVPDPSSAFWALTLDHQAITMSTTPPDHSIQLTAVPRAPSGAPLEGLPAATFFSGNTEVLSVSATGLLTARAPGFGVPVVARLTADGITHVDTAFVIAQPGPAPTVASFSIHPLPGDSAKFSVTGALGDPVRTLQPLGMDDLGNLLFLPARFRSLDPTVAGIHPHTGQIMPVRPGRVTFIASTTAYGALMADTLPYIIGTVLAAGVTVETVGGTNTTKFGPPEVTIGTGGIVFWENFTGIPVDVTFENPALAEAVPEHFNCEQGMPCDGGNITPFETSLAEIEADPSQIVAGQRVRRFSVPGTYTYRNTLANTTGTIVVVDESQ